MPNSEINQALRTLFSELTQGVDEGGDAFIVNSGDVGLLRSLDALDARQASVSSHGGATVAAHAQHVRYGLSLFNRWASEGGNPFADAKWGEAWKTSTVDATQWREIRAGLADEVRRWDDALGTPRDVNAIELAGMIASVAHLAYHLGAIRQIVRGTRGPKEGTFVPAGATASASP